MSNTKKLCHLAVLTALYVVLSSFLRFYIGIGHIQVDLGYIAFAVALCEFGIAGTVVGVVGCAIGSILFSNYGLSPSWVVTNAIIGFGCGMILPKTERFWVKVLVIVDYTAIGMIVIKTLMDCYLYAIPLAVKLPKSIAAFAMDTLVMCFGLMLHEILIKRKVLYEPNN